MEVELTIRGNTEELAPFLEFLGQKSASLRESSVSDGVSREIPVDTPWTFGLQDSLWNGLSESAKQLMMNICIECDSDGDIYGYWVCNPDGFGHDGRADEVFGEYCDEGTPCDNPFNHRRHLQDNGGMNVTSTECRILPQTIGASLTNIKRNMANPKYVDQTYPISKIDHKDTDSEGNPRPARYKLNTNWPLFVYEKWNSVITKKPSEIPGDHILGQYPSTYFSE